MNIEITQVGWEFISSYRIVKCFFTLSQGVAIDTVSSPRNDAATFLESLMFAPIRDLRGLIGVGSRVAEHSINSIPLHPFPSLEDIRRK